MKNFKNFNENFGFDWKHEMLMEDSISKWFTTNNIDFPIEMKNIKTDNEFKTRSNTFYIILHDGDIKQMVIDKDIPDEYINNVEISDYKDNRLIDIGVGTPRNKVDDLLTEINDYLYNKISDEDITKLKTKVNAKKFKI